MSLYSLYSNECDKLNVQTLQPLKLPQEATMYEVLPTLYFLPLAYKGK